MSETLTAQELNTLLAGQAVTLLDVRRPADREAQPASVAGAIWRDPVEVAVWGPALSRDLPVVIFCVRGGSVSASVQAVLRGQGLDVRYVQGGLAAIEAAR